MPGLGSYELLDRIGADDLSETYSARAVGANGLNRTVLFKRILPEIIKNAALDARLSRLAGRVGRLEHPNILRVLDFTRLPDGWCTVTEAVPGVRLRWMLDTLAHQALPTRIALGLHIVHSVCIGLAFAHQRQSVGGGSAPLVHEGVCPDAVLLGDNGCVKLIDFGLARFQPTARRAAYWAPEQARGEPADPRSDIFGAGAILYHCITGQPVCAATDLEDTLAHVKRSVITTPQQINPLISDPLEQIIVKSLAPNPAARYQKAEGMAKAIELIAHLDGVVLSATMLADWLRSARRSIGERRETVESVVHDDSPKDRIENPDSDELLAADAAIAKVTTPWDALLSAGSGALASATRRIAAASGTPTPETFAKETVPAPADQAGAEMAALVDPPSNDIAGAPVDRRGGPRDAPPGSATEQLLSTKDVDVVGDAAASSPPPRRGLAPQRSDDEEQWVAAQQWQRLEQVPAPAPANPAPAHTATVQTARPVALDHSWTPGPPPRAQAAWLLPAALGLSLVLLVLAYVALYFQVLRSDDSSDTSPVVVQAAEAAPPGTAESPWTDAVLPPYQNPAGGAKHAGDRAASTSPTTAESTTTRPGYLVVTTDPPRAEVVVDGRPTGRTTPVKPSAPLLLSPGPHRITLATTKGVSAEVMVEVKTGHTAQLFRDLHAPPR